MYVHVAYTARIIPTLHMAVNVPDVTVWHNVTMTL